MDAVMKNISDLERKLTKSNKIVSKGENMKLGDAIKLGRKSNSIVSTIKKGIKEYDGTDPTTEESKKVLAQMNTIVSLTETQLNLLVQNKAQFEKLRVGGLVKRSIGKTEDASMQLSNLMLEKAPAELKNDAAELEKRRKMAFDKATSTYSGATGGEDQAEGEDDSD